MINTYCGSIGDTLSQLVYFGLLNEGDGQCFRVNSVIESGSYVLLLGSILLGLIDSFVTKAIEQCCQDQLLQGSTRNTTATPTATSGPTKKDEEEDDGPDEAAAATTVREKIKPADVLFTDVYGWALTRS